MTGLPGALFFACVGFFTCLAWAVLVVALVVGWAIRGRRRAIDCVWWVRARLAQHRRPAWIPAAPKPLPPLPQRLTDARIEAELRRIGEETRADLGPDFARILGLFADDPHTTDH